ESGTVVAAAEEVRLREVAHRLRLAPQLRTHPVHSDVGQGNIGNRIERRGADGDDEADGAEEGEGGEGLSGLKHPGGEYTVVAAPDRPFLDVLHRATAADEAEGSDEDDAEEADDDGCAHSSSPPRSRRVRSK